MGRAMARLQTSSETVIAVTILTANLIRWEQNIFCLHDNYTISTDFFILDLPGCSLQLSNSERDT